jgi:hypothetical protein
VRHQRREQRREGGRAERGAQGLHEPDAGGGDPEVAPLDRGVHEQHLVAEPEAEAGAEHDHDGVEHGDRDPRRAEREPAERQRRTAEPPMIEAFIGRPDRAIRWPSSAPSPSPAATGSSCRPVWMAVEPRTSWRSNVR